MTLDLNRALQIKTLIEDSSINSIVTNAQRVYPDECCGFILDGGAVFPAQNIIENLYDRSLTRKNAFLIDSESWRLASINENPVVCIYHSHTNGDPSMSDTDKYTLRWKDLCYLIIGLVDTNPTSAKLFWWSEDEINELEINL